MLGARMPDLAGYDDAAMMEKLVLPMANIRFALEELLKNRRTIDDEQLARGLQAVHRSVTEIHDELALHRSDCETKEAERRLPIILQTFRRELFAPSAQSNLAS